MREEIVQKFQGFSAYQIKMMAVLAMTLDHLAAYGFEIPVFAAWKPWLRLIGRIAAPLFFFILTESIRHTRSKAKFLLRLYLGAVWVGLFVTATNYFWGESIGRFRQSNILYDYFYTALYCILAEQLIVSVKNKEWKRGALTMAGAAATCIPHFLYILIDEFSFASYGLSVEQVWTIRDFLGSFVRSPLAAEYTILFVIMGILMYFAKSKYGKAAVLVVFSLLCYLGGKCSGVLPTTLFVSVLGYPQYYMVLAAPIMLLYNGQKGKGQKYFFYLYYPLHRYAISILAYVYQWIGGV